jgi:hypothetical protein
MEFSKCCCAADEEQLVHEIFSKGGSDDTDIESDEEDMDTDAYNE